MHFKHITIHHSEYINGYFHTHILKPNSFPYSMPKTWHCTYSWLIYSIFSHRRANSARPGEGCLQNPHYGLWEERSFKT